MNFQSDGSRRLDPASLQVLLSRLSGVAEEMGAVLRRSAFSPNIKERADCSSAIFTPEGELLAQAEHIPVHLGAMPASVRAVIERFGNMCQPGDQFVVNDPFAGGTHLNDVTLVAPCFGTPGAASPLADISTEGNLRAEKSQAEHPELLGWVANRAHHADLGGAAPGSMPADATEIYQEGLRIPPVRLTDDITAMIVANSRTPEERKGDLDAQVGANICGVARLAALVENIVRDFPHSQDRSVMQAEGQIQQLPDSDDFLESDTDAAPNSTTPTATAQSLRLLAEVLSYGERRMRAALAELPDDSWQFSDVLDSCGPAPEQQKPSTISLKLTIAGEEIVFDFTGTDPVVRGNANAVRAVTESCVAFALRSATDPSIPSNGGTMRPVRIITPPNSLVAAEPPVAVGAGNVEVSQRIADVCLGALAQVAPDRVGAASAGTMNNILIGGDGWVYYETVAAGQGARPTKDGMSGVHTAMTNTRNTPIEALERAYPMRVLRLRIRQGSGGEGVYRGGDGIERDLEILEPATVSLITERRQSAPWGLAGGGPGAKGENWLLPARTPGTPASESTNSAAVNPKTSNPAVATLLPDKVTLQTEAGDIIRVLTPGGGGWGSQKS